MTIKELIKAELDNLSEEDLQEFYLLLKNRDQQQKSEGQKSGELDEWDLIIQDCQIDTGMSDLAYQHHHYIHGTPKIEVE